MGGGRGKQAIDQEPHGGNLLQRSVDVFRCSTIPQPRDRPGSQSEMGEI